MADEDLAVLKEPWRRTAVADPAGGTGEDQVSEPSLAGLLDAIESGTPVLGYCHLSLMDNFEWIFGYSEHLGLHSVDRETFVRTPKPSAAAYAEIARSGGVHPVAQGVVPTPRDQPMS